MTDPRRILLLLMAVALACADGPAWARDASVGERVERVAERVAEALRVEARRDVTRVGVFAPRVGVRRVEAAALAWGVTQEFVGRVRDDVCACRPPPVG